MIPSESDYFRAGFIVGLVFSLLVIVGFVFFLLVAAMVASGKAEARAPGAHYSIKCPCDLCIQKARQE